jgi:hypothetical protein
VQARVEEVGDAISEHLGRGNQYTSREFVVQRRRTDTPAAGEGSTARRRVTTPARRGDRQGEDELTVGEQLSHHTPLSSSSLPARREDLALLGATGWLY